ncbi:hypothetical protein [Pseudomonas frederiksbergensis]|uniref:hypothetical protein n=1 Tax=Pseudomonas frederiksbergensis TaxID=104087 RepID=UPI003D1DD58E
MSKTFDMELFFTGVLTGSHTSRQRHIHQAKTIQAAISERWQRNNPWTWQRKHLVWFLAQSQNQHAMSTRYHYLLTVRLLALRLGKPWQFRCLTAVDNSLGIAADDRSQA